MTLGHSCGPKTIQKSVQGRLLSANGSYSDQPRLLDLPDDIIFAILSYCDVRSLGRLSLVCHRLAFLVSQDSVWLALYRRLTAVKSLESRGRYKGPHPKLPVKELCRYANNWMRGHCVDTRLIQHAVKQLPWLQAENRYLWVSNKNHIRCYYQQANGTLREMPKKMLCGHREDVGRFVCKNNMIISGSRDRSIHVYSTVSGECLVLYPNCHAGDIQAVDCHFDTIVSGSRDTTIKIWNLEGFDTDAAHRLTIQAQDRVWSLAMNPTGSSFAAGTAGINHVAPLRVWDIDRGQLLAVLGNQYKHGAGVLDIQYETPDILISCGYDTYARLWDLRTSHTNCVLQWEEPFDTALYCVQSDGNHAVITGTARHGMVRLWDKRYKHPVQMYYTGRGSSPVYSMAYDCGRLYVALDRGINMLDFTIHGWHRG